MSRSVATRVQICYAFDSMPPSLLDIVRNGRPALVLAPMEGVTDAPMRALQTERGGFDYCVSEFLRVSQEVPPDHVILDYVPELRHGSATPSGAPVQVQLLGGDSEKLAATAEKAARLGAPGIDLNFGCPAPTVNRHDGGATLLKYPDRIRAIVEAVRKAVPAHLPVSAKLRLGFDNMNSIHLNADRAAEGGASWICIHGRTKIQGYTPPAYWGPIGEVRRRLQIPVIANGEIWSLDDFKRCRDETGCEHFMLGRGALADPALAPKIARELGITKTDPEAIGSLASRWLPILERFAIHCAPYVPNGGYTARRIKQWIRMASLKNEIEWWEPLKREQTLEGILEVLNYFTSRECADSLSSGQISRINCESSLFSSTAR
jgi:tRNA-dihydrouridine synthase C